MLKEDRAGQTQIASSLKVPLMLFSYGCPSGTGGSRAKRLTCHHDPGFLSPKPTKPAPTAKAGGVNTWLCHLGRKCPIAIIVQPPCWFCCICSFTLWATLLLVSIPTPITFLNCCFGSLTPICLGLSSCQNICVGLTANFIQLINLHPFCENTKTINFFDYHADAIVWLSRVAGLHCWEIWFWVHFLCK